MTCLLYGIVRSGSRPCGRDSAPLVLPAGVGGAVVTLVEADGLGAAVSVVPSADATPDVVRVLAFAKVVEALHARRTVLPMRYGCLLADAGRVVDLLHARGPEYAAILQGLDGCVEMGVRVLLLAEPSVPRSPREAATGPASGREYLTERAARARRGDRAARTLAAASERVLGALGGLAERTKTDRDGAARRRYASVDFLVKREAVTSFRRQFRSIERRESARLLLSGPWPPYTFVAPEPNGNGRD